MIPLSTLRPLKVKYYFYYNNNLNITLKTLKTPKTLVRNLRGLLVSLLGLSRISHVVVVLETEDGDVFVHSSHTDNTVWSSEPPTRQPDKVLVEEGEMEMSLLDTILPSWERYSLIRTGLFGLIGYPRYTINCVTVVHRIRFLLGRETRRRTPGGLYREIKQQAVFHQ